MIRWNDTDIQATVTELRRLDKYTVTFRLEIPGYGVTQEYLEEDEEHSEFQNLQINFPGAYWGKTARDFHWNCYGTDTGNVRDIINAFVRKFEKFKEQGIGLFICSHTKGTGKTLLACCLGNEIIERYHAAVRFISAVEYAEMTKNKEDVSRIRDAGILILDDIGAEDTREWTVDRMRDLVNHRYQEHLLTIFTSNRSWDSTHADDLIHSRIYGMSVPVALPEISIREKQADERIRDFVSSVL